MCQIAGLPSGINIRANQPPIGQFYYFLLSTSTTLQQLTVDSSDGDSTVQFFFNDLKLSFVSKLWGKMLNSTGYNFVDRYCYNILCKESVADLTWKYSRTVGHISIKHRSLIIAIFCSQYFYKKALCGYQLFKTVCRAKISYQKYCL